MRIKSYFASTVEAAVTRARHELGDDALLLGARAAAPEAAKLGRYEVTFGIPAEPAVPIPAEPSLLPDVPATPNAKPASRAAGGSSVHADLLRIHAEIEQLRSTLVRPEAATHASRLVQPYSWMYGRLVDTGIEPPLAAELIQGAQRRMERQNHRPTRELETADAQTALMAEMEGRFRTCSRLGHPDSPCQTVALVGPPGAGKTLALIRLAILKGVAERRKVRLISLDGSRIGGGLVLECYATLLDLEFQSVQRLQDLPSVAEQASADLILIDTPGFGPSESDALREAATAIGAIEGIVSHLVLPATLRGGDLDKAIGLYEPFHPSALLFTRLDEVESAASVFAAAARFNLPLSYLSSGQQVPDSLEEATSRRIVERVLFRLVEAAEPAA